MVYKYVYLSHTHKSRNIISVTSVVHKPPKVYSQSLRVFTQFFVQLTTFLLYSNMMMELYLGQIEDQTRFNHIPEFGSLKNDTNSGMLDRNTGNILAATKIAEPIHLSSEKNLTNPSGKTQAMQLFVGQDMGGKNTNVVFVSVPKTQARQIATGKQISQIHQTQTLQLVYYRYKHNRIAN